MSPDSSQPTKLSLKDLEQLVMRDVSKRHAIHVANIVGNNKKRFDKLMRLFLEGEYHVAQRAALVVNVCAERDPSLVIPYIKAMILRLEEQDIHDAVKRIIVRILQFVEIPRAHLGRVANACFKQLESPQSPIAAKVFSMTVLANLAMIEPDLKHEICLCIEQQLPYTGPAYHARARHVLKRIRG